MHLLVNNNNYCCVNESTIAHARLMGHREVSLVDAIATITIMECSMQGSALLGGVNVLHSAFPEDAHDEYDRQGARISYNNFVLTYFLH